MRLLWGALLTLTCAVGAQAQPFPSKPITLVLALPAGGAGGTLSIGRVVRSTPDGYTLGMGTLGQYVISGAVYTLNYDMLADLAPVARLPDVPYWMVVRKELPANNLQELASWLKSNGDKATASTTGTASMARFCGMGFQKATGTNIQYVPYRGGAPALNDLVAGQIDMICDLAANSLAQYRAGRIKALAVMTKTRWSAAPEVPTTDESGLPGLYYSTWHGTWAPKGTPADIVDKLNAAANAAMADAEVQKRIAALGMDLPPKEQTTPAGFAAFHKAEVEKWYPIVRAAGVKAE